MRYIYYRWNGTQKFSGADPYKVMDEMADSLIQGGDLLWALRTIVR